LATDTSREHDTDEVPLQIGGFPVVRVLGEGGMGRVYACRDEQLERIVAVKSLRPDLAKVPAILERFLREAKAMAKISSPHVVTVHQVGSQGDVPFLVMALLDGEDLSARVHRKGKLGFSEAVTYARDAVLGLAHAAEAGIIHRDVKPANLFLIEERVVLTDFGLALPVESGDARLTQEGLVVGTPHYLAPEVARGNEADEVSDIYSLGATFYELVTGGPPYPGEAALDVVSAHLHEPTPSIKKKRPDVPEAVHQLHQKMMAKKRDKRFGSYAELLAAIDRVLTTMEPYAPRATDPALAQPSRSNPRVSQIRSRPSGATPSIKTAELTVMIVDIVGFSERTGQSSPDEAAHWLALHDELLQTCVRAFRGKKVKTIADAQLMTFPDPTDAVLCATAMQDRLWQHNNAAPEDEAIHARIALSAGEVRVHKGDILGEPVNLATRIEKLASPGQVLFSDAVHNAMDVHALPAESIGEHTFKGIRRGVLVYRALPAGRADLEPYGGEALRRVTEKRGGKGPPRDTSFLQRMRALNPMVALGVVGGLLAVVLIGLLGWRLFGPPADRAAAEKELARIEAIPRKERTPADDIGRGHALRTLERNDDALVAYSRAARKNMFDDAALALALEVMQQERASKAVDYLGRWPDAALDKTLTDMLDDDWWARHNALLALEKRDIANDELRTAVGVLDLSGGETCGQRRYGLLLLKRAGRGKAALDAIAKAQERMPDNICMSLDFAAVEKAVKKRS
jgi:serine/threonine protein kinase